MASYKYVFGAADKIEQLFPSPQFADPSLGFKDYADVIRHYTNNSLVADGVMGITKIEVTKSGDVYHIKLENPAVDQHILERFGERHAQVFSKDYAQKAIRGMELLKELGVWNPMENYHVNSSQTDGTSKWTLFPSLGLNVMSQKGILLLHYPPWAVVQLGTFTNAITFRRWEQLLVCAGIPSEEASFFKTFMEVSPIAAPGSGESEYPNDYFPIMMASGFFDGGHDRDFIRSMLDLYLNPPGWPKDRKYTLPLLICGSALYDPQSPGWFRTAYTNILPQDEHGVPQVNVMQTGTFRVRPDSERDTPYMIANHMIAAGVTGACTNDPTKIPDIRQYEAQDLVAATFLKLYADNPDMSPQEAKAKACMRWFGNADGIGAPMPKNENDRLTICALAQMDLFFEPNPPRPKYTFEEAFQRCKTATIPGNPCFGNIKPPSSTNDSDNQSNNSNNQPNNADHQFINTHNQYFISVDNDSGIYNLWSIESEGDSFFKAIPIDKNCAVPKGSHLIQVGDYILQWSVLDETDKQHPFYSYKLMQFNPNASNPLGSYQDDKSETWKQEWTNIPLQLGTWPKKKFFSSRVDFANPNGGQKGFESGSDLILISMHNFVLNFIPTEGRGTNQLFNFDPGSLDPLPAPYSPQGAWAAIELGHQLMHINGYVLDWNQKTNEYVIWQFDAQAEGSLSYPPIQKGNWQKLGITSDHQLCVIGSYVLDWQPGNNNYRLWEFSLENENALVGPIKQGTLPKQIMSNSSLIPIETRIPVNAASAEIPGTMDFMRDKIEHVVYYMIENRSFDHICGWLYAKNEPFHLVGEKGPFRGVDEHFKNAFRGKQYGISKYNNGKLSDKITLDLDQQDPYHDCSDVLRQMFFTNLNDYYDKKEPDMGGFAWNNGTDEVMQAYSPEQIPVLNGLAKNYAISDAWFSSMPSGTTANRAFALTGSSLGQLNNFQNGALYAEWSQYPHRPSIWKTMFSNYIESFKIYSSVEWMECQYTYNLFLKGQIPSLDAAQKYYATQIDEFFDDLKKGTLPKFSFLEPKWVVFSGSTSYHPGNDLIPGELELNKIFTALQSSPLWNKTLFIITFDEHGGLPDHVPPPYAVKPWANDSFSGFTNDIMGVRVPTILVSPYIKPNTVFRTETGIPYDSTSILSTLLSWMGIPKSKWGLGERTNHAPTFESVFQEKVARTDKVVLDLPYDKNFPKQKAGPDQSNTITSELPVHDLHRLMVPGMIADMTPKLSAAERAKITDDILSTVRSLQELHKRLEEVHQMNSR